MTLNGAITELIIRREPSSMPDYFRPSLQKVIETLKEVAWDTKENSKPAVKGKWEERNIEDKECDPWGLFSRRFYCPFCGEWQTYGKTRYCPNCGEEVEKEEMEEET